MEIGGGVGGRGRGDDQCDGFVGVGIEGVEVEGGSAMR